MKKTQIDKAIEAFEAEIKIYQLAIDRLRQQQSAKPARPRKSKVVAMPAAEVGR